MILIYGHVFFCDRFVLLTSQKQNNMKSVKQLLIVAILSLGFFASCTPESLDNGTDQQIDRNEIEVPRQG